MQQPNISAFFHTAVQAARDAGRIIMQQFERLDPSQIQKKSQREWVSDVDRRAEEKIITLLKQSYPQHRFLAEESADDTVAMHTLNPDDFVWIIDPLDGTHNYIHGFPHFCVSIALWHQHKTWLGVIYDPLREEMFTAQRGKGAQKNQHRMRVNARTHWDGVIMATGYPIHDADYQSVFLSTLDTMATQMTRIRQTGSVALNLAYIACGRIDACWEYSLRPWDIAAGILIVREAGGLVSDEKGGEHYLTTGNVVAGAPFAFKHTLKILRQAQKHNTPSGTQ